MTDKRRGLVARTFAQKTGISLQDSPTNKGVSYKTAPQKRGMLQTIGALNNRGVLRTRAL